MNKCFLVFLITKLDDSASEKKSLVSRIFWLRIISNQAIVFQIMPKHQKVISAAIISITQS